MLAVDGPPALPSAHAMHEREAAVTIGAANHCGVAQSDNRARALGEDHVRALAPRQQQRGAVGEGHVVCVGHAAEEPRQAIERVAVAAGAQGVAAVM